MQTDLRNNGQTADPGNLTKTQAETLRRIWESAPPRVRGVGGSYRRMLQRLVRARLITRNAKPRFVLTPAGKKALAAYEDKHPGKCRQCGCTERRACPGPCSWVSGTNRTLCSGCYP